MKTSKKQQIAAAPKFTLKLDGAGYLASRQGLTGIRFTNDINDAMIFAVGFDNPQDKLSIWNAEAKRLFKQPNMLEVVNL